MQPDQTYFIELRDRRGHWHWWTKYYDYETAQRELSYLLGLDVQARMA